MRHGKQENLFADDNRWVYARETAGGEVIIAINNADQPAELHCPVGFPSGSRPDLLGGEPAQIEGGQLTIRLNARSAAIYRR